MNKEQAIEKLKELQHSDDNVEMVQCVAVKILCELLATLGYADVVAAYVKLPNIG
jgi:hypothetical protein